MKNLIIGLMCSVATFVGLRADVTLPNTSTIADIQAAIDAANPGDTITLADGTYVFDQALTIAKGITLTGSHRDRCILQGEGEVAFMTALTIDHKDACVKNITIAKFNSSAWFNYHAAGVQINAGLLTQSRVTECKTTGANRTVGVSLEGSAAVMSYCLVDHNRVTGSNGLGGVRIMGGGGTMFNCLVWANEGVNAGGVSIGPAGNVPVKIVNCTIVGNTATARAGGLEHSHNYASVSGGPWVVNTIVAGNTAPNGADIFFNKDSSRDYTGYNCLCPTVAYGANPQTKEPLFADAASGDFHLQADSPARNAGDKAKAAAVLSADLDDLLDFYGAARILETEVDIGCSEYEMQIGEDADKLTVVSEPQEYGTLNPACGKHRGYVAGTAYTLTAPANWTSVDGLTRAVCTNCVVTQVGGTVVASETFTAEEDFRSLTYTHPVCNDGVEAVWHWKVQNKVTVQSVGEGVVSREDTWVDYGGCFTVVATPEEGYCLYRWYDVASGETLGQETTLAIDVESPRTIAAEFIALGVIAFDLGVVDYSPIIAAVVRNADSGAVIRLQEGVYPLASPLVVNRNVTLQGDENDGTVLKSTYTAKAQNQSPVTVSGGATISHVAITGGLTANVWTAPGAGVTIKSGTLSHCAVTNNVYAGTGNNYGVGVYAPVEGGATVTITHCRIADNTSTADFNSTKGIGLYVAGSGAFRMDNCLVTGNTSTSGRTGDKNLSGGGLWINHSNAQIVNCTFAGNHHNNRGGGVFIDGGSPKFVNCIIVGNTADNAEDQCVYKPDISATSETISTAITEGSFNNLISAEVPIFGMNGLAADPQFVEDSYQLSATSPARNAGDKEKAAMALGSDLFGSLDFYGMPRVLEGQVDIGCAEFVPDDAVCSIVKSADAIYQGESITLTGSTLGFGDADDIVYTWTIVREGSEDPLVKIGTEVVLTPAETGTYAVSLTASSEKTQKSAEADSTTFLVKPPPMFYVGEQGYDTWRAAYDAVPNGGTIKVGANAKLGDNITVNKSITFDLCGRTLQWDSGWMCYSYQIIDTGVPSGSGRFELTGGNKNIGGATLDLSALSAEQFVPTGKFWTNAGTTILFPPDLPLKDCDKTYANRINGERMTAQGVAYVYDVATQKWKREKPLGLVILAF